MQRARLLGSVLLTLLLCGLVQAQNSNNNHTLNIVDKFSSGDAQLKVAEFTEKGEKVGVLGTTIGTQKVAAAFKSSDWAKFVDLWRQARQVNSPSWQMVGYYKEVGTTDPTLAIVLAGPSIRLMLIETGEMSTFDVQPGDYDRFDRAVDEVTNFFTR